MRAKQLRTSLLAKSNGQGFAKFLIDDNTTVANTEGCLLVLDLFLEDGPKYGFIVNSNKTKALLGKCETNDEAIIKFKKYQVKLGLSDEMAKTNILLHPDNNPSTCDFSYGLQYSDNSGLKILGSAIGSPEYIKQVLVTKIQQVQSEIDKVYKVPDIQTAWCFIFYVIRNKITYLLRTIHPDYTEDFCKQFDIILRNAVENIFDVNIDDTEWAQIVLPIRLGGCGLQNFPQVRLAAFLASYKDCFSEIEMLGNIANQSVKKYSPST